jgi:hypothetical protein
MSLLSPFVFLSVCLRLSEFICAQILLLFYVPSETFCAAMIILLGPIVIPDVIVTCLTAAEGI